MTNLDPRSAPDLFFAGGECLERHGTLVRHTDQVEDLADETATRNSDAQAIGRDGIIRTWETDLARVEWLNEADLDATRNLLPSSEPALFSNEIGAPTLQRGAKISKGVSLDRITDDSGAEQEYMEDRSDVVAGDFAFSVFIAAGDNVPTGGNQIVLRDLTASENRIVIKYDFDATGRLIDFVVTTGTASFEYRGRGVYRISSTFTQPTPTANSGMRVRCQPTQSAALTGDGLYGGAQLEVGTAVTAFQAMPRDPDRKVPSLLLEAAATNLLLRSAGFPNGSWTKIFATVTGDQSIAPDGTQSADYVADNSATDPGRVRQSPTIPSTALTYTASLYIDKTHGVGSDFLRFEMNMFGGVNDISAVNFDPNDGSFLVVSGLGTASVQDADLFWRLSLTLANAGGNTGIQLDIFPSFGLLPLTNPQDATLTGVKALWGAMIEEGAAPSSYISTSSVTVTREADNFVAPYPHPPQEMSVLCTWIERGGFTVNNARLFDIGNGASPRLLLRHSDPSNLQAIYGNVTAPVFNVAVPEIVPGALCEAVVVLHGDGSVQITAVAVNGVDLGRESLRGEPLGMAEAWSSPSVNIFGRGTTLDPYTGNALALKMHRGIHSLDFMRAL